MRGNEEKTAKSNVHKAARSLIVQRFDDRDGYSGYVLSALFNDADDSRRRGTMPVSPVAVFRSLLSSPASLPTYQVLKKSGEDEVFRAAIDLGDQETSVVCKHQRVTGWRSRLGLRFGASSAKREFDAAVLLVRAGISTAQPIALIQRKRSAESWLVFEDLSPAVDLDVVALSHLPSLETAKRRVVKQQLVATVASLAARLERSGLSHRDFKASNILVTDWDGRERPAKAYLVDVIGVHSKRFVRRTGRHPLVRLAASLYAYDSITRTDGVRFLKAYMNETNQNPHDWRDVYQRFSMAAIDYNKRARKRKKHKLDGYVMTK